MRRLSRKGVASLALLLFSFALVKGAFPQAMSHWSNAELMERAKHLQPQAAEKGNASEILEKYPHHFTMLAFRNRTGGGELHQNYADVFFILDGHCTLVTGGEVVDPKSTAPGETLGTSVKGGSRQELKAGDVVHIPAGMPHQMILADGDTVTYFVVKAEETR
jgi:mannose-6-phosphate isomerase-like protein (cupin superfamily)